MGPGAAEAEPLQGHAAAGPSGDRSEGEGLIGAHLAVRLMGLGEAEPTVKVERGENLAGKDRPWQVRGILGHRLDDAVGVRLSDVVP